MRVLCEYYGKVYLYNTRTYGTGTNPRGVCNLMYTGVFNLRFIFHRIGSSLLIFCNVNLKILNTVKYLSIKGHILTHIITNKKYGNTRSHIIRIYCYVQTFLPVGNPVNVITYTGVCLGCTTKAPVLSPIFQR
jgi:hypothetical protein